MKIKIINNKLFFNTTRKLFSKNKNSFYLWLSNVNPGIRSEDYYNKITLKSTPIKVDFFEDKQPTYVYCGPRHSAVITENGDLYTFGTGNWGILGHNNESSVGFTEPKLVEYFKKNNIKIKKVCLGDYHSLALSTEGNVYTWGFGGEKGYFGFFRRNPGALGHGDWKHYFEPRRVSFFKERNIKVKDISCGIYHSVCLSTEGKVYTFGRGLFGLLGTGSNRDELIPVENEFLGMIKNENSQNEIVKIDCADEYTVAQTKAGDLYAWGKNNSGQLGIGVGVGVDMTESENYPNLITKPYEEMKAVDFSCGDNGMMIKDQKNVIYKTGWRMDYTMTEFKVSKTIETDYFFCGNSYYCIVDKKGRIYQWGSLFKNNLGEPENDMIKIMKNDLFDGKKLIQVSGKFKMIGALVSNEDSNGSGSSNEDSKGNGITV